MRIEKTIEEEQENINAILIAGLNAGRLTQEEVNYAKTLTSWSSLQPILDRAQGFDFSGDKEGKREASEELRLAREITSLNKQDFTKAELEKLKTLAPGEYKMLK
ncbi:MAG: hypothetical protein IJ682_09130 [Lachnospiraceae bacterium]|nr:hypothetical protein [Lachnospiraceae bacterium]